MQSKSSFPLNDRTYTPLTSASSGAVGAPLSEAASPAWLREVGLRPFTFWNGEGNVLSSRFFDRALEKAIAGDEQSITVLCQTYERHRAACVLMGRGITRFDAWAFDRADRLMPDLTAIRFLAKLGLLKHARQPGSNRNLANQWVEWDLGPSMWKILAEAGVDLNWRNERGQTPLEEAGEYANHRLICNLVDLGADYAVLGWGPEDVLKFKSEVLKDQAQENA